jgi:hypothetical protein
LFYVINKIKFSFVFFVSARDDGLIEKAEQVLESQFTSAQRLFEKL